MKLIIDSLKMHFTLGAFGSTLLGLILASLSAAWLGYAYIDSKWPIALGVCVASMGFIWNDIVYDAAKIEAHEDVHTERNIIDRWWMPLLALVFPAPNWWGHGMLLLMIFGFYWIAFSMGLNIKRGLNPFYVSSFRDFAPLERLFDNNKWMVWGVKVVVFVLILVLYLKPNIHF